jgi:tetratricopeptide (TPR) repeat protein
MEMRHEPDQAAPNDWITLVNDRCDLELAFKALDGWDHFHTDTIRGRIRSLQLRPQEAWGYFEKAQDRADEYGRSLRNLLRQFYLKVYRFDNAIIEESAPEGGQPGKTESCLKDLLRGDTPNSEVASQLRLFNHGLYLLHRQDYAAARKLFKKLLRESRDRIGDEKTGFYFGAAVAHRALGEEAEAERQIENACLFIPALDNTFNMGIYAGTASALLRLWDREDEAQEWDEFLVRLKIPKKTADLFRERSKRILKRSASLKRVFLF